MDVNIVDYDNRKHLRINSPPVELFERSTEDEGVVLRLDVLEEWAKEVHEKNKQFTKTAILVGVAYNFYMNFDFGETLKIAWKEGETVVKKEDDYLEGIAAVMRATRDLIAKHK